MLTYILVVVLICIEAIANACMDKTVHHYNLSVFPKLAEKFHKWGIFKSLKDAENWFSQYGWKNKYVQQQPIYGRVKWTLFTFRVNKPVQLCDSWHFFKTISLVCYIVAISLSLLSDYQIHFGQEWVTITIHVIVLAVVRNLVFSLFYNKILLV